VGKCLSGKGDGLCIDRRKVEISKLSIEKALRYVESGLMTVDSLRRWRDAQIKSVEKWIEVDGRGELKMLNFPLE
jgi:hypothetical protein